MKKKKFSKINLVILSWFIILSFLSVGYSKYTSTLSVQSVASIEKYIADNVYITGMNISSSSGAASLAMSYKDQEIKSTISLPTCNSYVTYTMQVLNATDSLAYITSQNIISMTNGSGSSTNGFTVELSGVTFNKTYINPHSSLSIPVKIKNNCSTSDTSVNVDVKFNYSLYKKYNFVINSTPSDASITVNVSYPNSSNDASYTSSGTVTASIPEGSTVSWTASKTQYTTETGSITMPSSNYTKSVTLTQLRSFTLISNPSSEMVLCLNKDTNEYEMVQQGGGTFYVKNGTNIACSVSSTSQNEYYYTESDGEYYGYYNTFTVTSDVNLTITMKEKPWITSSIGNSNAEDSRHLVSVAQTGTLRNYHPGYYMIELYGSDGGNGYKGNGGNRGKYGYVYGIVYLNYDDVLYYSLGGHGASGCSGKSDNTYGGVNGGGRSESGYNYQGGGGGGYSILRKTNSAGDVIMVAGGAGGAGGPGGTMGGQNGSDGGNGARLGTNTLTSISSGVVIHGSNGAGGDSTYGVAGTTVAGYNAYSIDGGYAKTVGAAYQGGNGAYRGGGGGGGYFGGGAGVQRGGTNRSDVGGGGGGSGFLASSVNYSAAASRFSGSNPGCNKNDGADCSGGIVVSFVGRTMS